MDIAHDHKTCVSGAAPAGVDGDAEHLLAPIDWQVLRARLFAAHDPSGESGGRTSAAGGAASGNLNPGTRWRGSFDGGAALLLTTYEGSSRSINPSVSTNGKPEDSKNASVAEQAECGERG